MPYLSAAGPLVDGFVDLPTPLGSAQARCTGTGPGGQEEGGIGVGLGIRLTPATLTRQTLRVAAPGMCGAP